VSIVPSLITKGRFMTAPGGLRDSESHARATVLLYCTARPSHSVASKGGEQAGLCKGHERQTPEQRWTKGTLYSALTLSSSQYFHYNPFESAQVSIPVIPLALLLWLHHPPWSSSALKQPDGSHHRHQTAHAHPSRSPWHGIDAAAARAPFWYGRLSQLADLETRPCE
jgi:hypothetical protein